MSTQTELNDSPTTEIIKGNWNILKGKLKQKYAKLTDQERTQRRLVAASRIADLDAANNALWSTQSTLVISLVNGDGIDSGIVNEACAILTEYEELRYTRLQLEPPADAGVPVRWRQCQ